MLVLDLLHPAFTAQGTTSTWIQSLKNIIDNPQAHIFQPCEKRKVVMRLVYHYKQHADGK
jgi:hypothetical protein